jgi:pimeloyl-ACP methyl ester carboxylesterase
MSTGLVTVTIRALIIIGVVMASTQMMEAVAEDSAGSGRINVILVHGAWADGSSWSKVIPLLQAKGLHVTAIQIHLASLPDDVATTKRAIALQTGPVVLAGHSYGGAVITEAGNDPKVVGLVYVAAFAPGDGESVTAIGKPYPPAPLGAELRPDAQGFLSITPKGVSEDFGQDLTTNEKAILAVTQGPANAAAFDATIKSAAWKTKPSWFVIAGNDRAIPPDLQKAEAARMKATAITLPSSHLAMLSHPKDVAALIEKATKSAAMAATK